MLVIISDHIHPSRETLEFTKCLQTFIKNCSKKRQLEEDVRINLIGTGKKPPRLRGLLPLENAIVIIVMMTMMRRKG